MHLFGLGRLTENVRQIMDYADGGIVDTYFHRDGELSNPLDASRVRDFVLFWIKKCLIKMGDLSDNWPHSSEISCLL